MAKVQSNVGTNNSTSVTTTLPAAATAGNLLVAMLYSASGLASINTPAGWTPVTGLDPDRTNNNGEKSTWAFVKEAAGGETSVTITSPTSHRMSLHVYELSGRDVAAIIANPSVLLGDGAGSGSTAVTSFATPSIDPTDTGDVDFIALLHVNTDWASTATMTVDNGFTLGHTDAVRRSASAHKNATNPPATQTTFDWSLNGAAQRAGSAILAAPSAAVAGSPPVADAGADQTPTRTVNVILDGSGTTGATSYQWAQLSGPTVTINNATSAQANVDITEAGTYEFQLTATNADGSSTDNVLVTVTADNVRVRKVWDGTGWV